jgi:acetyltransferase-like isoleucine patch superfamily enzyme
MSIVVGRHTYGYEGVQIKTWERHNCVIHVGAFCSFGTNIRFFIDGNHRLDFFSSYPFNRIGANYPITAWGKSDPVIGNDVWISSDCTIFSGVTIGDGAVIAGQSVVTKSVPPYAIVGGNPAKIIRYRFDEKTIQDFLRLKWWDLPDSVIFSQLIPLHNDIPAIISTLEKIRSSSIQ